MTTSPSTISLDFFKTDTDYDGYACFDLDHTIIKPKSGKVFPKDKDDWEFLPDVKDVLESLHKSNWLVIILTNQGGVGKQISKEDITEKFTNIASCLPNNVYVLASIKNDYFRKPMNGMWNIIDGKFQTTGKPKFYCGDAHDPSHRKLKASDLKFAMNGEVSFVYPEIILIPGFTIDNLAHYITDSLKQTVANLDQLTESILTTISETSYAADLVIVSEFIKQYNYIFIIAPPSSGKSSFCKKHLCNYTRLSKDDYKTSSKYLKAVAANIGQPIVFDNTNYAKKSRDKIIDVLNLNGIDNSKIGFIIRDIVKSDSFYLNKYRTYTTKGDHKLLPDVAIHTYFKNKTLPEHNCITVGHMITELNPSHLNF